MTRYIDADKIFYRERMTVFYNSKPIKEDVAFKQDIENVQTEDVVPIIHAHWIEIYGGYICSNCGTEFSTVLPFCTRDRSMPKFCLHCGAIMDEEVEDD